MARRLSDRLHRIELALLTAGGIGTTLVLASSAKTTIGAMLEGQLAAVHVAIYGMKLLLMEAALIAPFVVLALLGRALVRETSRFGYRLAGLGISLGASAGVVGMLLAGLFPVDLEEAVDTLVGNVVPALVLSTACGGLYGALIWWAQHGRLDGVMRRTTTPTSHRPRG